MIRNCIIFRLTKGEPAAARRPPKPRAVTLREVAADSQGGMKRRIEALANLCRAEKISLSHVGGELADYRCSCQFRARRFLAGGGVPTPFLPVDFHVWVSRKRPWVATFEAGRRLSSAATTLVGKSLTNEVNSILPVRFEKNTFEQLFNWVTRPKSGAQGRVLRAGLGGIRLDGDAFRQVMFRADQLEKQPLFTQCFKAAEFVSHMTVITPSLRSTDRQVCCGVSDKGGITLYTANLLQPELLEIIDTIFDFAYPG